MTSEAKFSFFDFVSSEHLTEHGHLFVITVPMLFTNLTMCIAKLVDEGFVGQLSVIELAAVTASFAWLGLFMAPVGGLFMALGTLTAQAVGAKNYTMANGLLFASAAWSLGLFFLPVGFLWWMMGPIFRVMIRHHTNLFYKSVTIYTRLKAVSLGPLILDALLIIWVQSQGHAAIVTIVNIVTVVLAVILKYMLILGKWGVPSFGVAGAPLGDLVTQIVEAGLMTVAIFSIPDLARVIDLNNMGSAMNWDVFNRYFALAGPATLTSLGDSVAALATTMYAAKIWEGDASRLALVGVLSSVETVASCLVCAVGQAGMIRVSYSFGQSDLKATRRSLCVALEQSLMLGVVMSLAIVIFRKEISVLYTSDVSLRGEVAAYLPMLCITCTANSILYPLLFSIDAIGLPSKNAMCMLIGTFLVGIPAQALLGLWWIRADPILGLWLGNAIGAYATIAMGAWVYWSCDLKGLMKEAAFHRENYTQEPQETDSLLEKEKVPAANKDIETNPI